MPDLTPSRNAYYYEHDNGGVVILDVVSGRWIALNSTASDHWRAWSVGKDLSYSVATVAARCPGVPRTLIQAGAESLRAELTARGLIGAVPARWYCTPVVTAGIVMAETRSAEKITGIRSRLRLTAALVCIALASLMVRRSFRTAIWLVCSSRRRWCQTVPDAVAARRAVAAVSKASCFYPGRSACLELSLATVLLAAVRRRRLDWCIGSAINPYQFHAWVELQGKPLPDPARTIEDMRYRRILAV